MSAASIRTATRPRCGFISKGGRIKTKGIHFSAAEAIKENIAVADIASGPLFRPRVSKHDERLASRRMTEQSMCRVLMGYLEQLPGAFQEQELPSQGKVRICIYSPHSLRATTATLLLDNAVMLESVQDLLDHKHITTTQITTRDGDPCGTVPRIRCRFEARGAYHLLRVLFQDFDPGIRSAAADTTPPSTRIRSKSAAPSRRFFTSW